MAHDADLPLGPSAGPPSSFRIIASCRLHDIGPQRYLEEVLLVLPWWPRDEYLDLAPVRWARTRARFEEADFQDPLGPMGLPVLD